MENNNRQKVVQIISNYAHMSIAEISDAQEIKSVGVDEYGKLNLVFDLEDQFGIEFPVEFWKHKLEDQFKTVGNIIEMVERLLEKKVKTGC